MSDGNRISILPEAPDSQMTDSALINVAVVDATSSTGFTSKKSPLSRLAAYILNKFTGLSLGGSSQTVKAAIDSLNSNLTNLSSGTILDYVKSQVAAGISEGHFVATVNVTDIPASGNAWFVHYVKNIGSNIVQLTATQYNDSRVIYNTHIGNYQSSTSFAREWTQEPTRAEITDIQTNPFPIRGTLTASDDLNNILESGVYGVSTAIPANVPSDATGSYGLLLVFGGIIGTTVWVFQIYAYTGRALYYRRRFGSMSSTWNEWTKVTGTVVS